MLEYLNIVDMWYNGSQAGNKWYIWKSNTEGGWMVFKSNYHTIMAMTASLKHNWHVI
jgi:hypothetical protein